MKTRTATLLALGVVLKLALFAGLAWHASSRAAEPDVPKLLAEADRYRKSAESLQIDMLITTQRADGSTDKERRYTVYAPNARQSLVLMKSPAEAGQKVLMLGDDFWLLMPGSQRPMRITPSQKLLGDASTGDIATLSWADDYDGQVQGEDRCEVEGAAPRACLHLSLAARRKGVSYQRIELWIGKQRHEPIKAELYVQSDKLAKQARFVFDKPAAPTTVVEMHLQDHLSSQKTTRVQYLSRQARSVPENWLNPMYLARNPTLE